MTFSRGGFRQTLFAAITLLAGTASASAGSIGSAPVESLEVSARPISEFHIGRTDRQFGPLEFVGGLEMTSPSRDFGALSAFRFLKAGSDFIGVADTGYWFFGSVARDADRRPIGIQNFRMQQMVDQKGQPSDEKWEADAEGLAVKDGIATVGFERNHRVAQFRIDPADMKAPFRQLDFLVPARELRQNRGFETVARSNVNGQHRGGLVVVSERSLDKAGNIYAAIIEGPRKGVFTVKRNGDFDISDGAFLPDGDLLLLERSFTMAGGLRMRLRRIHGESVEKGAVADGPVLLEADMGYQIDNMEGLDIWTREDGALMVSLISDDNHSILQRNLYLEFILHQD
ncbi:esterase-like activity of phytase family protein [Mesorhizobium sp. ES1-4]|uniref:esterase-like activity of phytase family protein n=1 Tax=Mesorhizobium sp. ES1-4 TaxID=2876627 RepID=UPI001CCDB769|nr:esterase-like activity of phytase family protein [Mesorhizobium sp. ES1-4]MBZ9796436.1 esterase-like activity of phytase family protein [Mesorhizobium sp. ES1-4]